MSTCAGSACSIEGANLSSSVWNAWMRSTLARRASASGLCGCAAITTPPRVRPLRRQGGHRPSRAIHRTSAPRNRARLRRGKRFFLPRPSPPMVRAVRQSRRTYPRAPTPLPGRWHVPRPALAAHPPENRPQTSGAYKRRGRRARSPRSSYPRDVFDLRLDPGDVDTARHRVDPEVAQVSGEDFLDDLFQSRHQRRLDEPVAGFAQIGDLANDLPLGRYLAEGGGHRLGADPRSLTAEPLGGVLGLHRGELLGDAAAAGRLLLLGGAPGGFRLGLAAILFGGDAVAFGLRLGRALALVEGQRAAQSAARIDPDDLGQRVGDRLIGLVDRLECLGIRRARGVALGLDLTAMGPAQPDQIDNLGRALVVDDDRGRGNAGELLEPRLERRHLLGQALAERRLIVPDAGLEFAGKLVVAHAVFSRLKSGSGTWRGSTLRCGRSSGASGRCSSAQRSRVS